MIKDVISDISQSLQNNPCLDELHGSDHALHLLIRKIQDHYKPFIPDSVVNFQGGTLAFRENVFDIIRNLCRLRPDEGRGRKIVMHPLLLVSLVDYRVRLIPQTFVPCSDRLSGIYFGGKNQWGLSVSINEDKYNVLTCPHPTCLIGTYTHPSEVRDHSDILLS